MSRRQRGWVFLTVRDWVVLVGLLVLVGICVGVLLGFALSDAGVM